MRTILAVVSALAISASAASAQDAAANYPNRPIKIVVSVPAGGGVDRVTRIVADGLHKKLGQPVVVENRAGAGGNIGAEFVFTAAPDGYTLLASQPSPITVNPLLYKKMNFDPTQFEPVAIMTEIANVLLVRPDFPAKTAQEFLAYCKANPGKVNYASQGIGTTSHLTAALFEKVTGTKLVHVPYKGTGQAVPALLGLAEAARAAGIGFTIDAEEADRLEPSLDLVESLALAPDLAGWDGLGLAVQADQTGANIRPAGCPGEGLVRHFSTGFLGGGFHHRYLGSDRLRGLWQFPH